MSDMQTIADLSVTLFLTPVGEYNGGELIIRDEDGIRSAKFEAGDVLLYSASSIHHVAPITRGPGFRLFSGCRASCGMPPSGECCSTWTGRFRI